MGISGVSAQVGTRHDPGGLLSCEGQQKVFALHLAHRLGWILMCAMLGRFVFRDSRFGASV